MRKSISILLIALLVVALVVPGSALAAKKGKKAKKNPSTSPSGANVRMFDAGVDFGLPIFGVLQLGSIDYTDADQTASFSGSGTVSFPYLGTHFTLYPSREWYVQFGLGYIHQSGQATYKSDDIDTIDGEKFDWGSNVFRLDAGIGKIFGTYRAIRPKAGAGLGLYYLSFYDKDDPHDDTFAGWTVGPFGLVGVDFDIPKVGGAWGDVYAGVNLRTDLIYSISPLMYSGDGNLEMHVFYMPWSIFITGGVRF